MPAPLLVYGITGYTGQLIARRALERGLTPRLAGRDAAKVRPIAEALGCSWAAFPLEDEATLRREVAAAGAVLHCAGPFLRTFRPVVEACLAARVHYLDITGELPVFQAIAALGSRAEAAGVMLMPGAGFDVVPTDCLAAHVVRRLPGATRLALAFQGLGGVSIGTARTMVTVGPGRDAPHGSGPARRTIDLGAGPAAAFSIPWGDVFTARRATGVTDVTVYMAIPAGRAMVLGALVGAAPLLNRLGLSERAAKVIAGGRSGPSAAARTRHGSRVWAEAVDALGRRAVARLTGPNPYDLTALAAVELAERALRGEVKPGWQTPASAFGPDFVTGLPGVAREDVAG
jgi:short subunit dehydrogenase-like uncharacterized protein